VAVGEFQPTPPREGRLGVIRRNVNRRRVSTHAPARGATADSALLHDGVGRFNPRPRARGDPRPGHRLYS